MATDDLLTSSDKTGPSDKTRAESSHCSPRHEFLKRDRVLTGCTFHPIRAVADSPEDRFEAEQHLRTRKKKGLGPLFEKVRTID